MNHLLAFHVGPVQDFIATARRTQDWWMGSWLLSHLSYTAMKTAKDKGAGLILPKELPPATETADTPNHFLASIPDTQPDPVGIAQAVETAVRCEWLCIAQKVKSEFFGSVDQSLWTRQVGTFLEIYWAVVPCDGSTEARNRAQAALDARKRLRDFCPTCEPHLKCTLCGVRQELSGKATRDEARDWWTDLLPLHVKREHLEKLRLRENERLCAVCAVKRGALPAKGVPLQKEVGSFPSTSSVAAAMFKKRLLKTGKAKDELAAHLQTLEKALFIRPGKIEKDCIPQLAEVSNSRNAEVELLTFDGDLFYVETFIEKRMCAEFPDVPAAILRHGAAELDLTQEELLEFEPTYVAQQIAKAAASLRALFRAVRSDDPTQHIPPPSKYFAALMMDGDHMGAFYGKMEEPQAREMSGQMSQFARQRAREVVKRHFGRLVYAGGDDMLALLPLEEALSCARELQVEFGKAVEAAIQGVNLPEGVKRPTPSIGICIAHHTQPLDATLLAMQRAEKDAKNKYGRNALCVHLLKRSGEEVQVGTHWKYGAVDAVDLTNRVVAAFHDDTLTMKFAHAVADEARSLAGVEGDKFPLPAEARAAALKRLAKRHCGKGKETEAQSITAELASWAEGKHEDDKKPLGVEEVAQWILLARFIASGGRDSE